MWGWLKRMGSDCWSQHEWISKADTHRMWLECRHCGMETAGVDVPPARYVRTQDGVDEAHRLGGMAPARLAARAAAPVAPPLRFSARRAWDATTASSAVASTDAERRWLQAFRVLSPDERAAAERQVASLRHPARPTQAARRDEDRLVG